jgi:hypothetical protein
MHRRVPRSTARKFRITETRSIRARINERVRAISYAGKVRVTVEMFVMRALKS